MAAAICGHLRLKGEAAKLRGRRICCSFGDESLTIKGEVSTFLAVQRSAFGENWRQRGNVLKPTLVLRDGASETEVNVDALLRGEASVVEAALDDSVRFWIEYIPAPPEPRRGDVVELEPWSHHGAVVPHNNDGLDFTVAPAPTASCGSPGWNGRPRCPTTTLRGSATSRSRGRRCASRGGTRGPTPWRGRRRRCARPKPDGA